MGSAVACSNRTSGRARIARGVAMKKPITFRLNKLHADLSPLVERRCGIRDFSKSTHFGRGIRGNDEIEYILSDGKLYSLYFVDMDVMLGLVAKPELSEADVTITLVDGDEKREILDDLTEQTRIVDHTPGYVVYTPPGGEPEIAPQRYWLNKPQPSLDLRGAEGKITEDDGHVKIELSRDEDQN